MLKFFKQVPTNLAIMFWCFLLVPLWSFVFLNINISTVSFQPPLIRFLIIFSYWLGPLLICIAIYLRSFLLIPLFILECLLVILHVIINIHHQPTELQTLRLIMAAIMSTMGVIFADKELLFPLLAKTNRPWRLFPRIYANTRLYIMTPSLAKIQLVMEDCSATGMAACGEHEKIVNWLNQHNREQEFIVIGGPRNQEIKLTFKLVWFKHLGLVTRLGMRSIDQQAMARFMDFVNKDRKATERIGGIFASHWFKSSFRNLTFAIWAIAMALTFAIPV